MEYVQMTLEEWAGIKRKLEREIREARQSVVEARKGFIRIGYLLRRIKDRKLYEQDGYKSITEFAGKEYGLGPSDTSHLMKLNREYSVDGYSETLCPEYARLGKGQLVEMMGLPEKDRAMVQPEAYREDIRELKRFNREPPEPGVADGLHQLVCRFYQDNPDILKAVYRGMPFGEQDVRRFAETVNPGGNRSYRKGIYFLMMYENRVAVKKFGEDPQDLTWQQFYRLTVDAVGDVLSEPGEILKKTDQKDTGSGWEKIKEGQAVEKAGQEEPVQDRGTARAEPDVAEEEKSVQEQGVTGIRSSVEQDVPGKEKGGGESDHAAGNNYVEQGGPRTAGSSGETIVPAQKYQKIREGEADRGNEPAEPEDIGMTHETRKEYMDSLTARELAEYIMEECKSGGLTIHTLEHVDEMLTWLLEAVDGEGRQTGDAE